MPILVTAALLFGTSAAIEGLRFLRPRFRFTWLLASSAIAIAWLSVLLWPPQLPLALDVPLWRAAGSPNSFATFSVDRLSWPYAFGLLTLALAILLTAPARPTFPNTTNWALCLTVAGLALLAAVAASPLTVVLFWAGLDLVEAGVVLARTESRASGLQAAAAFVARLGSIALALLALVLGDRSQTAAGFAGIEGVGTWLLPLAALLRLSSLAFPWLPNAALSPVDEVGVALQLASAVSATAFLTQLRTGAQQAGWAVLLLCMIAALYAGWMWLRAPDRHSGRPLWIMGMGSLAVAASLRGDVMGSTGLSNATLLAGAALFLSASNDRWLNRAVLAGLWICSTLPFSLSATAWLAGGGMLDLLLPGLLVAQAMLAGGFLHQALSPETGALGHLRSQSLSGISRAGIVLPLAGGMLLGIWGWPGALQFGAPMAAVVVIVLVAPLTWAKRRFASLSPAPTRWVPPAWQAAVSAIVHEVDELHASLQRRIEGFSRIIEGEAGIMWSLLLLMLFVSLLASRGQ